MPTARISCPHCARSLKAGKPLAAGGRVRCPHCDTAFVAGPVRGVRPLPDPLDDEPRGRSWLPLVGLAGIGLLLLLGAGVVVTVLLALRGVPKTSDQAASGTKTDPITLNHDGGARPPFVPAASPAPPAQSWLPPDKQNEVNRAIDRGVEHLKDMQTPQGTWEFGAWPIGQAALPGLTLLECGVPPDDGHVRAAADFVREHAPKTAKTYELALAILFLDKLGDSRDESLIRTMALQLMAGQTATGGWRYDCPVLSDQDQMSLWTLLQTTRPQSSLELTTTDRGESRVGDLFSGRVSAGQTPDAPASGATIPLTPGPSDEERRQAKLIYDGLSGPLKNMPALQPPLAENRMPGADGSDNSNTQFATLGLWAAGRHGVPMERALARLAERFQVSQGQDGGWIYYYGRGGAPLSQPAMTGAGLLGVAVGHGLTAGLKGQDAGAVGGDPVVENGMKALARHIGQERGGPAANKYFLWSVERVGMLYNRPAIDGKEWYPWGADILIKSQQTHGGWAGGSYPGANPTSDTCFALLFLKRANLAKDLSTRLEFLNQVK